MKLSQIQWANHVREMMKLPKRNTKECSEHEHRMFRSTLGVSLRTIEKLWNMLEPLEKISEQAKPKHLLWTLVFLKVNKTEPVHLQLTGCKSRDTYRQWVKRFLEAIADLESQVIVFEHRFKNWNGKSQCLICIDGTDVPINEPGN